MTPTLCFETMNYTQLYDMLPLNQHTYVIGSDIIIFLLTLIAFCQVTNFIFSLYNLFCNKDDKNRMR